MKKIKRKPFAQGRTKFPAFVIGYSNADPPPAGFLSAWFNNAFEEQLDITFPTTNSMTVFNVGVQNGKAQIHTEASAEVARTWHERLDWIHPHAAEVYAPRTSKPHREEQILFFARMARGLTELTDGTAYDVGTGTYTNPSDWITQPMNKFIFSDHIKIEQVDHQNEGHVWFHTRGLGKFGFEEIEAYKSTGLSATPVIEALESIADSIILRGKRLRVGDLFGIDGTGQVAKIVHHRTDQTYGMQLNFREVVWG